jgi:dTDP-4-dehydrorhamnose reductase
MADKILILGTTGMLGHSLFKHLARDGRFDVTGTARSSENLSKWFTGQEYRKIISPVLADDFDCITGLLEKEKPSCIINCIGLIKQLPLSEKPLPAIRLNALFPHQLADVCQKFDARLIHISTDCVFSGKKGLYTELDPSDAEDLYGRTKFLGEVAHNKCITLRTSIIGHELQSKHGLIEWFLSQQGVVKGFTQAIYSGFPTVEMNRIISDFVLPDPSLTGLYHVSSDPISKYDLLNLVAKYYKKLIEIVPFDEFECDRSLDSTRFRNVTGYQPPSWSDLVNAMHADFLKTYR